MSQQPHQTAGLIGQTALHSPHCCRSRGCHDVCSHACGTDIEAIPICYEHEYCRANQAIVQARIEAAERRNYGGQS